MLRAIRLLAGPVFVLAGTLHFTHTKVYERIMPPYVPAHREMVLTSGVAEIAGGLALMSPSPKVRRFGAWWLLATLAAVFPANVHMALNPGRYDVPEAALWARLPLQVLLVLWAWAAGHVCATSHNDRT